ncbi:unnamed protein product [Aureobasidium mustum]|uniref:Uncharacterized protein n=1 Tax=Aureobasidium mustum TaxID=2773714 RepID=A0A9N8PJT5_9PEZI|nr:unnamed protein product [Aureobasidium mustum]
MSISVSEFETRLRETLIANNGRLPMPDRFNIVLNIEKSLQQDEHQTWGFVIYRCTYTSDADWAEFMRRFRMRTEEALEYFQRRYLMDAKLIFTVIEDRDVFESASTSTVREHFKRWVMDAPLREQGRGAGRSPRYKYCIHVDSISVHSVLQDSPAEGRHNSTEGFVNLIDKGWKLDSDNWDEWDELDPSSNEPNEPIEGVQLWDVGWMRVRYHSVMVEMYNSLRNGAVWIREYRRPPQVADS